MKLKFENKLNYVLIKDQNDSIVVTYPKNSYAILKDFFENDTISITVAYEHDLLIKFKYDDVLEPASIDIDDLITILSDYSSK